MGKKISEKTLKSVFRRHFLLQAAFNSERQQALGYGYLMVPALRELYGDDKEKFKAGLKRHLEFFNCAAATTPFIAGISCAMEEQNANLEGEEMDQESVNSVKVALMGPLAGIGDSFFWGTFRLIAAGIGAPLALQGNMLGPFLYVLINIIPSLFVRFYGFRIGFKGGNTFLTRVAADGTFNKLTESAKIMGLIVVGSLIASMVNINIAATFDLSGSVLVIQDILNQICPNILPLGLVFACYAALKKKISPTIILLVLLVLSVVLVGFGIV